MNTFCGPKDFRIGLSKLWTLINIFVSTTNLSVIFLVYIVPNSNGIIRVLGFFGIPLHILGVVLTVTFLFYDSLCSTCCSSCCCECCIGQSEVAVFDPRFPEKNLVWREGQVQLTNNKKSNHYNIDFKRSLILIWLRMFQMLMRRRFNLNP